ncbi:MAG: hypothetical protein OES46_21415 [Gammaproteobacteria bacterium]|nr:hypothetical protein [Gammaproteobacteria bacterium]
MATAISLLVILTLSAIAVRAGAVALWLTGLPEYMARFQATSAFTTTGFTTHQASLVVNHPDRRRIIIVLMILGNAGIVSVMATVILSYVNFEASVETLAQEALWMTLGAAMFWVVGLSKWADRHTTRFIRWCLRGMRRLDSERMESILLLPNGYQVAAIMIGDGNETVSDLLSGARVAGRQVIVLGVLHSDDTYTSAPVEDVHAQAADRVLLYGRTRDLEARLRATRSPR